MKKIKLIEFNLFRVMLGPYIKSRGTRGTKMSANADLITVETNVQQRGKQFENHFWAKMKKNVYFGGILGALRGVFNDQTKPILLSSFLITEQTNL